MNRSTLLSVCLLPLFFCSSCKKAQAPAKAPTLPPAEVDVMTAVSEQLPVNSNLPGRLEPYRQAEVRARVTGIVQKRGYEEGQHVKKGEVLFQIDPAPLKAALDGCEANVARAEAVLADARHKMKQYGALVDKQAVSKREHTLAIAQEAQAKAELDSALAARKKAQLELGYAQVESPIDGIARRALVTEGAYVNQNESTHLTTVEQIHPIYVRFSQPVAELSERQRSVLSGKWEGIALEDIKVHLILPDGSTYPRAGKLFFSDRAVDPQTDTVEMRAEFPNPQMELLPGTYVRVSFDSAIRKNIFRVPRNAVSRTAQGAVVLTVNDRNLIEPVPVQTEQMDGKSWIITGGLKGGERIVTSKASRLAPGSSVRIAAPRANQQASPGGIVSTH